MIYNEIMPMKFRCQKVLPLVYDDSLSYYETLCKISAKLNEVIGAINELSETQTEEDSNEQES